MGIDITDFYIGGGGTSARFEQVGDKVSGTVTAGELVDDPQRSGERVLVLTIDDVVTRNELSLWVRAPGLREALANAVSESGCKTVDPGSTLDVKFTGEKPLSGGKSMKLYAAKYTPGAGLR